MADYVDPFDDANFAKSSLFDDKVFTIVGVKAETDKFTNADGSAVLNDKGEQVTQNVLAVTILSEDADREQRQVYSTGALRPTEDHLGLQDASGKPLDGVNVKLHGNSAAARFFTAIRKGGFDTKLLFPGGKQNFGALVGSKWTGKGVDKLDRNGEVKKNKKGYAIQDFYPAKFLGFSDKKVVAVADVREKAVEVVKALLAEAGGTLTKANMMRQAAGKLVGKPHANDILTYITKDEFHKSAPWHFDGTTLTQIPF